jgi:hypothetical protein
VILAAPACRCASASEIDEAGSPPAARIFLRASPFPSPAQAVRCVHADSVDVVEHHSQHLSVQCIGSQYKA